MWWLSLMGSGITPMILLPMRSDESYWIDLPTFEVTYTML